MRQRLVILTLMLCSMCGAETYPPDGAHMLGQVSEITLQWDLPGKEFQVVVQGAGRPLLDTVVRERGLTMPVRPGVLYRWMVSPLTSGTGSWQTFQFSSGADFRFNGRPAPLDRRQTNSIHGLAGLPGGDAPTLELDLQPTPAGVLLSLQNRKFLLIDSTPPISIEARGGQGGEGGHGQAGLAGSAINPYDADGRPGGDGGQGGPGGRGGTIVVTSHGVPVEKYLRFDVSGGPGGPGGRGGRGGLGNLGYFNNGQAFRGRDGRDGNPGRPGNEGPSGSVQIR